MSEYSYYKNRIKQEYYNIKKLFYTENSYPIHTNINQYLYNQNIGFHYELNSLTGTRITIEEILDNDFFVSNNYNLSIRAMDFFIINAYGFNDSQIASIFKYLNRFMKIFNDVKKPPISEPFGNSLRLNNLIWFYQLAFTKLNSKQKSDLVRMIIFFGDLVCLFLENHLDNNHTIVQSKNLLLAGLVFKDTRKSKKWIKRGQSAVISCLTKQVDENGVHIERSTMYQKVVFSELLELSAFVAKYPDAVSLALKKLLWKKLKLMTGYDCEMTFDMGYYSLWGDGYYGDRLIRFVPVYSPDNKNSHYEENIKSWSCHLDIPAFGSNKNIDISLANYSGFIYSRLDNVTLIVNAGTELSKKKFAKGHLHSDLLSFVLFKDGKEIINHAGTYDYTKESITYLRGTRGHNTIMIDSLEQHGFQDESQSNHFADGFVDLLDKNDYSHHILMHHDGYERIGVNHKREIMHDLKKGGITITDCIEGIGDHQCEYNIHFAPGVVCSLSGNIISMKNVGIFDFDLPDNCSMELFYGDEDPGAWCSRIIFKKEPIFIVRITSSLINTLKIKAHLSFVN